MHTIFCYLPKEETVLHGIIYRLTEVGQYYGMEMNVENLTYCESQDKSKTIWNISTIWVA